MASDLKQLDDPVVVEINDAAMQLPQPACARLKSRTEFSITLFVPETPDANVVFRFEYKEQGQSWTDESAVKAKTSQPSDQEIVLDDLNPTSTYEIRIYAVDRTQQKQDSKPSETAAVDTEVPGCTPSPTCSFCAIL